MPAFINEQGNKYGRLTVIKRADKTGRVYWLCQCDCGNKTEVASQYLRNGRTQSCGCLQRELASERRTSHGMSSSALYFIWQGIRDRCFNPNSDSYKNYGERGITMCERWSESFEAFASDMGEPSKGMTIERIDNDGDYSPENCRWASRQEQVRNTRHNRMITFDGQTMCMSEWAEKTGISYSAISQRLNRLGWSVDRALTTPNRRTH